MFEVSVSDLVKDVFNGSAVVNTVWLYAYIVARENITRVMRNTLGIL